MKIHMQPGLNPIAYALEVGGGPGIQGVPERMDLGLRRTIQNGPRNCTPGPGTATTVMQGHLPLPATRTSPGAAIAMFQISKFKALREITSKGLKDEEYKLSMGRGNDS